MELVSALSKLCETYRGHDQLLALFGYSSSMVAGLYPENSAKRQKYLTIATQIVNCRTILRFLDDFSMLQYTITYGLGKHEKNLIVRIATIISNLASQIYYPCEHIAWLADVKFLTIKSDKLWFISILMWLVSSLMTVISTTILLKNSLKTENDENTNPIKKFKLSKIQLKQLLLLIKEFNFCILAIHWLPGGFLWSQKLTRFQSGFLGSIAIALNLIRLII